MAVTPDSSFELARLEAWHGLKPGMPRAEALAIIGRAGVPTATRADEPGWLKAEGDWGMVLRFVDEGSGPEGERLRQISVENERYQWNGKMLLGMPLHLALDVLEGEASEAGWRREDAVCDPLGEAALTDTTAISDELLLSEGTLWLPGSGVGLVMADGVVTDVVWRRPGDVPQPFVGPVTDAQRELSRRPDLGEHLLAAWKLRHQPPPPSRKRNALEIALAVLLLLALSYLGWRAWREMTSWQDAAKLPIQSTQIDEIKPEWLADNGSPHGFTEPADPDQALTLRPAVLDATPQGVNDPVKIRFMENAPPHLGNPLRADEVSFPWELCAASVAAICLVGLGFFGRRTRAC